MTNWKLDLSDDQRFALMKFRKNVTDICTDPRKGGDHFLLRWLKARNFDPVAAEKMLRDSLKWRKEFDVDNLQSWTPPEPLINRLPCGITGFDKQGSPILVVPFCQIDMSGILHSVSKNDMIRAVLKVLEGFVELGLKQGEQYGPDAMQLVAIFDLTEFNMKQYAWRPAADLILSLVQIYEAHYPEILKVCYVVNVPKVFSLAWRVVRKFLHEYTINKIHLYKSDQAKWIPILLAQIEPDQLPKFIGGKLTDPDGNPKCVTIIPQIGKVPKSMYSRKPIDKILEENYTQLVVKKGDKSNIDFLIPQEGYFLKWCFQSEGHDIKFGISCKDLDGRNHQIIPIHRVASHQNEEIGIFECPAPATYTIIFDNTYSILRNKKIHYNVSVRPPLPLAKEACFAEENEV